MASSLATILYKYFNMRSQHTLNLIDRCPLFVNSNRPLKNKILKGSKKSVVRAHLFILNTYYSVTNCNHCGVVIWGVAPQGYQCTNCEMNIHKHCVKQLEETCVGQVHRNEKGRDTKLGSFFSRIKPDERDKISRKSSQVNPGHIEKARNCLQEETILGSFPENESLSGEKILSSSGIGTKEQRRSDPGTGHGSSQGSSSAGGQSNNGAALEEDLTIPLEDAEDSLGEPLFPAPSSNFTADNVSNNISKSQSNAHKKRGSSSINRSESCKEKHHARKQTRETRKNSDPNIPTSKSSDVDGDSALTFHSGSSSNSSLSQSQESPPGNASEQVQVYASALDSDSDVEADPDLPDWTQRLSSEELEKLSSKDRKRQDTINEFFHTEQSHVRVLKVLQYLFHQPLRQSNYVSSELLDLLFPNLDQMLKFHTSFNKAMKKRRQESPLVNNVGDILTSMFEGEEGSQFQQAAADFIASQSFALESLRQQQKRDPKLTNFLQDQENHPHCRRLHLKDMIPAVFQRLSKYPLLLESFLSYTDRSKQADEYEQISRALERSKEVLAFVNAAVQEAENQRRLRDIQKRLDQSSLIKNKHGKEEPRVQELDLTKHRLMHEGPLTWKTRGQKSIDLHVLVLEEGVVLLQKDNDKYLLRYHSITKSKETKEDSKINHLPIIKFGQFLVRPVATDKCAFFLVLTQSSISAQIYELVAISPNEAKVWLKNLHEGQASHDAKDRKGGPGSRIIPDAEENVPADPLRDVEDVEEGDNADGGDSLSRQESQLQTEATSQNSMAPPANSQSPPSPESLLSKRTELLRRKDHKIREELQIKQDLIAQILNIPKQHFESVADMAGEMGLSNKEPRELVLGAIYQAKKLQEALNDAQSVKECDIMSAQASNDSSRASSLPLYPAPMDKLISISGNLTQLLNALLSLVSERDDERDRMRKELVASRERLHQLHMQQNKVDPPETGASASRTDTTSPHSSRPSSFVSVGSSAADHSEAVPDHPNNQDGDGDESRIIPFSQNVSSEGNLSKCYDTSDCDTGLSQTSISEESEILRVPAPAEPSPPSLPEDAGST